ncbi:5'-nucleotidase, lipoprotein e(P4) family [Vibrio sp. MEBiC08052]|uniref:5'-nucleotidase, lipoprotein e(P4) family n=1 Tax=Vibrio sp. MEBiC08052 TaxID=1761910 RepID=UPI0007407703|nr:5'-nucleotidase, lipoprotein e(P4) family [Vibrio sp. MEBiC08052]KUJ00521.1 Acid phosphatase lipoprotein [Vibrio sp. MEBiC08052]
MKTNAILSVALMAVSGLSWASDDICQPKSYEMALRYQQQSAEIKAIQLQTYHLATERLHTILKQSDQKPQELAVVLDLDETVLDNTPLLVRDMENCVDYTTWDTWSDWEIKGHPTLIPGAKAFIDQANKLGLNIYYVSDRFNENKSYTIETLKALGIPQAEKSHVLLYGKTKEQRRQSVAARHKIIMLLGDSLPDFAAGFKNKQDTDYNRNLVEKHKAHLGVDWFVLPNASYGAWKKASLNSWSEK